MKLRIQEFKKYMDNHIAMLYMKGMTRRKIVSNEYGD